MILAGLAEALVLMGANAVAYVRYAPLVSLFVWMNRYLPNIARPRAINEKIFWRKVFDRNPEFVRYSDKLVSKEIVRERTPEIAIPENLWIGTSGADIPDEVFARPVVVKTNHGWRYNIFAEDGRPPPEQLEHELDRWVSGTWGGRLGEWGYRDIEPLAFVEEMVLDQGERARIELRVRVYGGRAAGFTMITDRWTGLRLGRYDREGRLLPALPNDKPQPDGPPPDCFRAAMRASDELGHGLDHIRCDFFVVDNELYFNEFAVYPASGLRRGADREPYTDAWDLTQSWFLTTPQRGWRRLCAWAMRRSLARG